MLIILFQLPLSLSTSKVRLRHEVSFGTAFELRNMADPVLNDLQVKYQPLVGMNFQGTYEGEYPMPQTDNMRDIISVRQGDPFATILRGVSNAVLRTYGQQVWKGITGPEQSPKYTDYWLWVEPGFNGGLELGHLYNFQITQCTPFACGAGSVFSHGVSLKAVIPPA